jgi:hypothetical protein
VPLFPWPSCDEPWMAEEPTASICVRREAPVCVNLCLLVGKAGPTQSCTSYSWRPMRRTKINSNAPGPDRQLTRSERPARRWATHRAGHLTRTATRAGRWSAPVAGNPARGGSHRRSRRRCDCPSGDSLESLLNRRGRRGHREPPNASGLLASGQD